MFRSHQNRTFAALVKAAMCTCTLAQLRIFQHQFIVNWFLLFGNCCIIIVAKLRKKVQCVVCTVIYSQNKNIVEFFPLSCKIHFGAHSSFYRHSDNIWHREPYQAVSKYGKYLFYRKVTSVLTCGLELIWEKLTVSDLVGVENMKAIFLKRELGISKKAPMVFSHRGSKIDIIAAILISTQSHER